jgi:hypothetical protein
MDRLSVVCAALVTPIAVAAILFLAADGTPAARVERADLELAQRLREADASLAAGAGQTALVRLRAAHHAALRTERWDAMAEVGDAARRASAMASPPGRAVAMASRAYLAGLARAREQRSLDGVLRIAEGFAALGDREMVEYCIGVATLLAEGDREAERVTRVTRVQSFMERYREVRPVTREGLSE